MDQRSRYSDKFFAGHADGSKFGANVCLKICIELLNPKSMVDVGCGVGTWANEAAAGGIKDVLGVDGDYVDQGALLIPSDRFVARDLEQPLELGRTFDLAISMEVAEHLTPERAESFIRELTQLAPAVLFSAAIPGQGGTHHINEQWQDYWAGLFAQYGYRPVDCIRPAVWNDPTVPFWYRQNAILYLAPDSQVAAPTEEGMPLRVVHPELLSAQRSSIKPSEWLKQAPQMVRALLKGAVRRLMRPFR